MSMFRTHDAELIRLLNLPVVLLCKPAETSRGGVVDIRSTNSTESPIFVLETSTLSEEHV